MLNNKFTLLNLIIKGDNLMLEDVVAQFNEALFDTDRNQAMQIACDAVDEGYSPKDIVFKVVIPAVDKMIKAISEDMDANLAQHFMTSQIAAEVTEKMVSRFDEPPQKIGIVVIGTSKDDLHTLGKRIVIGCLKSMMIDVIDLGTNVPAQKFVDEAVDNNAQVIAISSMMVHTATNEDGCIKVRQILKEKDLESKIKIIVGGAPYRFDSNLYKRVGADGWADDGITAGKVIADMIKEVQS